MTASLYCFQIGIPNGKQVRKDAAENEHQNKTTAILFDPFCMLHPMDPDKSAKVNLRLQVKVRYRTRCRSRFHLRLDKVFDRLALRCRARSVIFIQSQITKESAHLLQNDFLNSA